MSVSAENTASGVLVKVFVERKSSVMVGAVLMGGSFLNISFVQVTTCRVRGARPGVNGAASSWSPRLCGPERVVQVNYMNRP